MNFSEELSDFSGMNLLMTDAVIVRLESIDRSKGILALSFRNEGDDPISISVHDVTLNDNVVLVKMGGERVDFDRQIRLPAGERETAAFPPVPKISQSIPCAVRMTLEVDGQEGNALCCYILCIYVDPDYDSVSSEAEEKSVRKDGKEEDAAKNPAAEGTGQRGIREIASFAISTGTTEAALQELLARNRAGEREQLHAMTDFYLKEGMAEKAVYNLKRLAGMGDAEGIYRLAMVDIANESYAEAVEMIGRLKKAGQPEGYFLHGLLYAYGPESMRDRKEGLRMLEQCLKSADQMGMGAELYAVAYKVIADCRIDVYPGDPAQLRKAQEEYRKAREYGYAPQTDRIEFIDKKIEAIGLSGYRMKKKALICCIVAAVLLAAGLLANRLTRDRYQDAEEMMTYTVSRSADTADGETEEEETEEEEEEQEELQQEEDSPEEIAAEEEQILMTVTVSSANIRSAPGTENGVVASGSQGETYVYAGSQEQDESGSIWYEIYLDGEQTQTGWASEAVIEMQE